MTQKHSLFAGLILFIFAATDTVYADFNSIRIGDGWFAYGRQTDPFDSEVIELTTIRKHNFTFTCTSMDFVSRANTSYDLFRFNTEVALKVDDNLPVRREGHWSSGRFGSDIWNDRWHFSTELLPSEIAQMKQGAELNVAGKLSDTWERRTLDLRGFTHAYGVLCD